MQTARVMVAEKKKRFIREYAKEGMPMFMIQNISPKRPLYFRLDAEGRRPVVTAKKTAMFVLDPDGVFCRNCFPFTVTAH